MQVKEILLEKTYVMQKIIKFKLNVVKFEFQQTLVQRSALPLMRQTTINGINRISSEVQQLRKQPLQQPRFSNDFRSNLCKPTFFFLFKINSEIRINESIMK